MINKAYKYIKSNLHDAIYYPPNLLFKYKGLFTVLCWIFVKTGISDFMVYKRYGYHITYNKTRYIDWKWQ